MSLYRIRYCQKTKRFYKEWEEITSLYKIKYCKKTKKFYKECNIIKAVA